MKKQLIAITAAGLWIVFFEFFRNQLLFISFWENHYAELGLEFKSGPAQGLVWMTWSFTLAAVLAYLMRKFTVKETVLVGWIAGFVMMWLVTANLGVLPLKLLLFAIPLSLIEVGVAAHIIFSLERSK